MKIDSCILLGKKPLPGGYIQKNISGILAKAGIIPGGTKLWDIQVNDPKFYERVFRDGPLGLGESYLEGLWDAAAPDVTIYKLLVADIEKKPDNYFKRFLCSLSRMFSNAQSPRRARRDIHRHYDLGNDLFGAMLDERMIYSCAYWQNAKTLEEAQQNKLDLICRKLKLRPGQRLLDIGCGWGGLAGHAAENYGVEVVGITLSPEQAIIARDRTSHLPVQIHIQDYRTLRDRFDRIVSVGMMEHVGCQNHRIFMEVVARSLRDNGLFLLHTIGSPTSHTRTDPWINRYIFPNGLIPSISQIAGAAEGKLVMEDWHNFGMDYDLTLMEWRRRFQQAWPGLRDRYDVTFYRMWDYYLCCSAASFRAKKNQLWQMVFSTPKNQGSYTSVR